MRDTEVLLQTKVKERDILKGFKVNRCGHQVCTKTLSCSILRAKISQFTVCLFVLLVVVL